MQRKENNIVFFLTFFGLSLTLILLGKSGMLNSLSAFINKSTFPVKEATLNIFGFQNETIKKLASENRELRKKALENQNLILENKALKDQFALSTPSSQNLLPAKVVGSPGFIPGVSLPEYLIIDKGLKDNVVLGDSVVVGNNLIGRIINSTDNFSKVELINHQNSTFAGKIASQDGREVAGVVKGGGSEKLTFENVLLALPLKKEDIVLSRGEKNLPDGKAGERGEGYPPDLVVGKVTSVEKKSSDLFQKAEVKSFVDFSNLSVVFVLLERVE